MVDGPAAGPGKRKTDEANLDEPTPPARHIKRLRPAASNRDGNAAGQIEDGVLATIERDTHTAASTEMELDSDADDEREISWSPSPDRDLSIPGEANRTKTNPERPDAAPESERAPSLFVPLPAREPTPINTLHNYHGGVAPERRPKQPQRKSTKRRTQPSGPRRTVHNYYDGSNDPMVLIADLEQLSKIARLGTGAKEVIFRTKAQFERHFGRPPTKAEMDETCTMTSFEPGVFRSKPRIWKTTDVGEKDDWKDEYNERDQEFGALMSKVGQSEKSFRDRIATGLLSEEMGKFQTPAGERRRHQAYLEALKAGQYIPDALIRLEDGSYKAIYLKLYKGTRDLTSFKAVTEKYGKDNVWLRTADFDYMTHEQFDRHGTTVDAAEKMFCEYTGRTYRPNVFVRVSDGKWVSKERYDEQNRNNFDEDLTEIEILALGKHNQGFLQPKTLKWMDPDLYQQRMRDAHLTGYVPSQPVSSRGALKLEPICDILSAKPNRSSAAILMQTSKDEIVSIATIPPGIERYKIFPQNVSVKTGEYTGNYTRNWRSIRREEKFREAAAGRDDLYPQLVDGPEKPKRLVTDEQRRILRTPSPSLAGSDVSEDESSTRRNSASLPPDSSDDEVRPPPSGKAAPAFAAARQF